MIVVVSNCYAITAVVLFPLTKAHFHCSLQRKNSVDAVKTGRNRDAVLSHTKNNSGDLLDFPRSIF